MKKLLLAAAFFIGVPFAFTSCNNGAYDADPVSDLSTVKNPLDVPGGPAYMSCNVDNQKYIGRFSLTGIFSGSSIMASSTGTITSDDTSTYELKVGVLNFSVPGSYTEPDSTVLISLGRTTVPNNIFTNANSSHNCAVTITEFNPAYVNGTFSGRIRYNSDYKVITNGVFHVQF